ncbi:MAG: CRTAC1 family protein [Planctomycetes bacterium]|nr:CRTAC1 family protein [Planctomycetota bacterium]
MDDSTIGRWCRVVGGLPLQDHDSPSARWLVALWATLLFLLPACGSDEGKGPKPEGAGTTSDAPEPHWFTEVTEGSGVSFTCEAHPKGQLLMPAIMGGGLALFDADGDGDLDIYFANGNDRLPAATTEAQQQNRFFRQVSPWKFVDATAESGLGCTGYSMGVAIGDVDADGDLDVYLNNFGPDVLYLNRGDGTFEDATRRAGIDVPGWSVSSAFVDYDRDGDLDIFVTQYVKFEGSKRCSDTAGRPEFCGPTAFPPCPDVLLRNEGNGKFTDVSKESGIAAVAAAGLGVVCDDFDADGWIDLYVANDAYANNLWVNRGDGTFVDEGVLRGVAFNMNGQAEAGMGVIAADFDGDTWTDLFMTHLVRESNTLYRNLGSDHGFQDDTGTSGLAASSMNFTGFGVAGLDVDLDGDLDLAIANGRVTHEVRNPTTKVKPPYDEYAEPNLFYTNRGNGKFQVDASHADAFTSAVEVGRGLVAGDIDGDGDLDLVLSNLESPARLYRNDAPRVGSWLVVRAIDGVTEVVGARIVIRDARRVQARTTSRALGYGSSGPASAHFGLPDPVEELSVRWPDGHRESFPVPELNRSLTVVRGTGRALP